MEVGLNESGLGLKNIEVFPAPLSPRAYSTVSTIKLLNIDPEASGPNDAACLSDGYWIVYVKYMAQFLPAKSRPSPHAVSHNPHMV
jgi:hypothetical protein